MPVALGVADAMGHMQGLDADRFLSALWREAPFTRLPPDAPPELHDYVEDVRDPRRSYAVHRASRRHDFQNLVAWLVQVHQFGRSLIADLSDPSFMLQLRKGCGDALCDNSSCFTCRVRFAGTKPVRRYSPTSARILSVYMAGCENPYDNLCPGLRPVFSGATTSITGTKRPSSLPCLAPNMQRPRVSHKSGYDEHKQTGNILKIQLHRRSSRDDTDCDVPGAIVPEPLQSAMSRTSAQFTVSDRPASKDHRSFAAATFETVAFKMIQWLTPGGVHSLSDALTRLLAHQQHPVTSINDNVVHLDVTGSPKASPQETEPTITDHQASSTQHSSTYASQRSRRSGSLSRMDNFLASSEDSDASTKPERRRSTGSLMISTSGGHAKRTKVYQMERYEDKKSTVLTEDAKSLRRVRDWFPVHGPQHDAWTNGTRHQRNAKKPDLASDDAVHYPSERHHAPAADCHGKGTRSQAPRNNCKWRRLRPQTLGRLNPALVDFICEIYSEDGTAERQHAFASDAKDYGPLRDDVGTKLRRLTMNNALQYPLQWKAFNDQAIFSVLSEPHALIASFTHRGQMMDSQSMWYCLTRLTRVMPDLVFHSLWLAAENLLLAPVDLQYTHADDAASQSRSSSLSQSEAGSLMAICFHALVAAVPIVPDSRTLYEVSRVRAGGQTLGTSASGVRQNLVLTLEYDDVFSNDHALRLARRLFLAIAAGRRYADLRRRRNHKPPQASRDAILGKLLTQLDFINSNVSPLLKFSPADRLLHETRVPTLLLDWARAVLMTSWDGQPYFPEDNAFGGAMAFISAMCEFQEPKLDLFPPMMMICLRPIDQQRNSLLLGDVQFRVDYFSDRLDTVEIPVAWASPKQLPRVGHLLDYPFLFTSDTLVSFFRSINFARMSKTYEESSSLQSRMEAIVRPGSLITNPHHKFVLQDLLRTASAKYLILHIGRKHVLRDTFDQLWRREERELLRPLKIHLGEDAGEEGFDSGGVQQEFFRLAISECLDPLYGAFTVDERTRMAWFVPGSVVELWRFELVGVLMSLALFNGLTLPVTFPRALYRKLLGADVSELHHIADGWPDLVSGLTTLLEWDESSGSVEDVFARTYDFSVSAFGRYISKTMKDDDSRWPSSVSMAAAQPLPDPPAEEGPLVTNANKDDYVGDYIRYLTDVSVRQQYQAFEKGFRRCLCPRALKLLSPSILQSLVEGIQDIDVLELRRNTRYVGWDASHRAVKDFWSIVKKYDLDMRRRLLEFVTASDRVPVGGMRNMQFVIQKNGEEEGDKGRLPTAYTCYGTLLLPEYSDRDTLRERLGMALENAQGFGFA